MSLHTQSGLVFPRKPPRPPSPTSIALIGTDTAHGAAKGIYWSRFDPSTGHFTQPALAAPTLRPSYFVLNRVKPDRPILYVANEGDDTTSAISSYALSYSPDPTFTLLEHVSSGGEGPCYVSVDASGRNVFVANYNGGTVASYVVQPDGTLSGPVDRIDFHNKLFGSRGPVAARQDGPHPHSAMLSPDNRFLLVNDLGHDTITLFPLHLDTGHLGTPRVVETHAPGSGPRHLAFHPNGRWAYGINELSETIDVYLWNATRGSAGLPAEALLTYTGQTLPTVDPGFHGVNTAAEILVRPAGDFLYCSNRGENSMAVFHIDAASGALTFAQRISCGGRTPRHFTFDPTGRWLVCGNQDSASITVFRCDSVSGRLDGPVQTLSIESPLFTLFV